MIQGQADVNFWWRDRQGKTHHEALAKEAIKVWIMPPEYGESWKRHFMPHGPIPAELIASGHAGRVYGYQTHRLVKKDEFNILLKQAVQTSWPDSPHDKRGALSWADWKKDLGSTLKSVAAGTSDCPTCSSSGPDGKRGDFFLQFLGARPLSFSLALRFAKCQRPADQGALGKHKFR